MAKFGVFCPPWTGHLIPLCTLAGELAARGHSVVFFQVAGTAEWVRGRGFPVVTYGEDTCPAGTLAASLQTMSRLEGLAVSKAGLDLLITHAEALFATAPPLIEAAAVDLWIVDHLDYAASTLAACMGAPFVSVIVGLMRHSEDDVPGFSGEAYPLDDAGRERDRQFNAAMRETSRPFREFIGRYREKAGLGPFRYDTLWSGLAQITQQPAEFEFPRRELPACFHFTGPFARHCDREAVPFPWERLSGKPLVYASFGSTLNPRRALADGVVEVASRLDVQVVLVWRDAGTLEGLPENLIVTPFAPQLELLERTDVMITHAGMNSALECLAAGVPMVAVPLASDAPGIAARIEWTGTGVRIPAAEPARLPQAVAQVLAEPRFRAAARRFQRIIAEGDGLNRAASIIEEVAATGRPVLREG